MATQSIKARNQFRGKIKEIIIGTVVSEVDVETPRAYLGREGLMRLRTQTLSRPGRLGEKAALQEFGLP